MFVKRQILTYAAVLCAVIFATHSKIEAQQEIDPLFVNCNRFTDDTKKSICIWFAYHYNMQPFTITKIDGSDDQYRIRFKQLDGTSDPPPGPLYTEIWCFFDLDVQWNGVGTDPTPLGDPVKDVDSCYSRWVLPVRATNCCRCQPIRKFLRRLVCPRCLRR